MNEIAIVKKLGNAKRLLAECNSFDKAKEIMDLAESARHFAKMNGLSGETQSLATELKMRSARWLGDALANTERSTGGRPSETCSHVGTPFTLEQIGVSRKDSHRWQRIAAIDEAEFERHIEETKAAEKELDVSRASRRNNQAKQPNLKPGRFTSPWKNSPGMLQNWRPTFARQLRNRRPPNADHRRTVPANWTPLRRR